VANTVPQDAALGIVARQGYFLDYLFFGEGFSRKVYPIKNGDIRAQPQYSQLDYLLITPDYQEFGSADLFIIAEQNGWRILGR